MLVLIIVLLSAMLVSFFCSLMEACLLSLSRSDIARLAENKPTASAIWRRLKANIQKPLAAVLIINTLANVVGAFFSGTQFNRLFGDKWSFGFSLVLSYMLIQWCEILPKTLGVRHNRAIASIAARPFAAVVAALGPMIRAIEMMNHPFYGGKNSPAESSVSDIRVLARSAALDNLITKEQESLISRSVHLSTLKARDVMIERADINTLSTTMNLSDGLIAAHLYRHTRLPLAENGDVDRIIGYVNFKDIVGALHVNPADPSLRGIMRPVSFVKDRTGIPELLTKLTRGYQHIAIVQNDKGATLGLVTLEDIIETLVGDLQDEYDTPPDFIVRLSETRFRLGGSATFRQIRARAYGDLLRDDDATLDEAFKQMAGGKTPPENSSFKIDGISFKVRRVVRGNIYDVVAEKLPPAAT
jgi:CBS domain containing-hemolysin-like protein